MALTWVGYFAERPYLDVFGEADISKLCSNHLRLDQPIIVFDYIDIYVSLYRGHLRVKPSSVEVQHSTEAELEICRWGQLA